MKSGRLINLEQTGEGFLESRVVQHRKIRLRKRLFPLVIIVNGKHIAQLPPLQAQLHVKPKEEPVVPELNHVARLAA